MKVESVKELRQEPLLRALIYGNSGAGKTTLLGTACECEETYPLLVLNAGGNPISLRNFEPPPLILTLESLSDLNDPYKWFSEDQPWNYIEAHHERSPFASAVWTFFNGEESKFKMVAIDSLTYLQRMAGDELVGNQAVLPGTQPKALEGFTDWRKMLNQTVNIVERYVHLPLHVWFTALTRHNDVPTLGVTMFYPFLLGQSSLEVPSYAEMVGRLLPTRTLPTSQSQALKKASPSEFEQAYNVLVLQAGRDYDANWKGVDDPPEFILDPTMRKILDYLIHE